MSILSPLDLSGWWLAAWWLSGSIGWILFHVAVQVHDLDFARSRRMLHQEPVHVSLLSVIFYALGGSMGLIALMMGVGTFACIMTVRSKIWRETWARLSARRISTHRFP